jgi:nicotinate phosphoribosyltransferase
VDHLLRTDGYKFSMAEAGFPLRRETFYLSFRHGGWQYIPFDLEAEIHSMLPTEVNADAERQDFFAHHGYTANFPMMRALREASFNVEITAAPQGTWVYEREPIVTITGPSFAVSWLEPLILRLFYPIQLATLIKSRSLLGDALRCTCEEQARIARRVCDSVGLYDSQSSLVTVNADEYRKGVKSNAERLLSLVSAERIFEVGMRSATCDEQHRICLETLRELGINKTSNVEAARDLMMQPVGTMGHEHVQRWGNDLDAYRAMRDMRSEAPTYLLDTFDTISSGIPAVVRVLHERAHDCSIRYDSGDKFGQYVYAHGEFQRHGLEPTHILEDSLDDEATSRFETLRKFHTHLAPEKQLYGYGGYLVQGGWSNPLTRDRVSAVYKLSETSGEPRMKFGNEAGLGKTSVPGRPVAWRRLRGSGPLSVIAQLGEETPADYVCLNGAEDKACEAMRICRVDRDLPSQVPYVLSPATQNLVANLRARHSRA